MPEKLNILAKDKVFEISLNDIGFAYDFDSSVGEAFEMYRENNIGNLLIYRNISFFRQINFGLKFNYDKQKLDEYLEILSSQVSVSNSISNSISDSVSNPVYPSSPSRTGEKPASSFFGHAGSPSRVNADF